MPFTVTLSDKYASGEASQDNCEAYLSFCESIDTLPRTTLTVLRVKMGNNELGQQIRNRVDMSHRA
jgi:hypothetical protein